MHGRAPGQRLIPIPMNEEFIAEIDAALAPAGYRDRAKFVRDAVWERLKQLGYPIPKSITLAAAGLFAMECGGSPPLSPPRQATAPHSGGKPPHSNPNTPTTGIRIFPTCV